MPLGRNRLPVRWQSTQIVVMDDVVISKPYTVGDCRATAASQQPGVLSRVKLMVEKERTKMTERGGRRRRKERVQLPLLLLRHPLCPQWER